MGKYLMAIVALLGLAACQDHYRYPCPNPDNFHKPDCQKPKCQFTQMCPEYLVAPILEKQVNAVQQSNQSAPEPSPGK